ncbi:MAG: hypothetical protein ABR568_08295 [Pyrinomonadaceae bacterium]
MRVCKLKTLKRDVRPPVIDVRLKSIFAQAEFPRAIMADFSAQKVVHKKDQTLTPHSFQRPLNWLDEVPKISQDVTAYNYDGGLMPPIYFRSGENNLDRH